MFAGDENADSWSMGPQHALLCVKQAKAYLDGILALGWDGACSTIVEHELTEWFGHKAGFCNAAQNGGAGEPAIRAFLGGAFADGRAVRDALLCVKQAKAYLEDPDNVSTIVETLFDGDERSASICIGKGAGEDVVLKLLSGAFTLRRCGRRLPV